MTATPTLGPGSVVRFYVPTGGKVVSGVPYLLLNNGLKAYQTENYSFGQGNYASVFEYKVGPTHSNQSIADIEAVQFVMNNAQMVDDFGRPITGGVASWITSKTPLQPVVSPGPINQSTGPGVDGPIQIDTTAPTVTGVDIVGNPTNLTLGQTVTFEVHFTTTVNVAPAGGGEIPELVLSNNGRAYYTSGSGTDMLNYSYTVGADQSTNHLEIRDALGSNLIKDNYGNQSVLAAAYKAIQGDVVVDASVQQLAQSIASWDRGVHLSISSATMTTPAGMEPQGLFGHGHG